MCVYFFYSRVSFYLLFSTFFLHFFILSLVFIPVYLFVRGSSSRRMHKNGIATSKKKRENKLFSFFWYRSKITCLVIWLMDELFVIIHFYRERDKRGGLKENIICYMRNFSLSRVIARYYLCTFAHVSDNEAWGGFFFSYSSPLCKMKC